MVKLARSIVKINPRDSKVASMMVNGMDLERNTSRMAKLNSKADSTLVISMVKPVLSSEMMVLKDTKAPSLMVVGKARALNTSIMMSFNSLGHS